MSPFADKIDGNTGLFFVRASKDGPIRQRSKAKWLSRKFNLVYNKKIRLYFDLD